MLFLELITEKLGKIYSNQDIVNYFTTLDEKIDPQNIRKLVSKLRKKLPAESLESIYCIGYRMLSIR
ncbi:MAG: helix-turn-helix domain-containing protein [Campylobacterota bacterium]|nr:helix-turn-helix domain-containing protein [Campylobacterota bacterium]